MRAPRWVFDGIGIASGVHAAADEPDRSALIEIDPSALDPDPLVRPMPDAPNCALEVRCDRRGHLLLRVWPTTHGLLAVTAYDSGRPTRRQTNGEVLRTIRYRDARAFLLTGQLSGSEGRCWCAELPVDAPSRAHLLMLAKMRPGRVALEDALCSAVCSHRQDN